VFLRALTALPVSSHTAAPPAGEERQGFDYERAAEELGVPQGFAVEAMAAVGRPGEIDDLPEAKRQRETPKGRKELAEIAFAGRFGS